MTAEKQEAVRDLLRRLGRADLLVLRAGLAADDPRLCRFVTTDPCAVLPNLAEPCRGACALVYPYLVSHPGATAFDVSREFGRRATALVPGPLLQVWDDELLTRQEAVAFLLGEVQAVLGEGVP